MAKRTLTDDQFFTCVRIYRVLEAKSELTRDNFIKAVKKAEPKLTVTLLREAYTRIRKEGAASPAVVEKKSEPLFSKEVLSSLVISDEAAREKRKSSVGSFIASEQDEEGTTIVEGFSAADGTIVVTGAHFDDGAPIPRGSQIKIVNQFGVEIHAVDSRADLFKVLVRMKTLAYRFDTLHPSECFIEFPSDPCDLVRCDMPLNALAERC